jgi:hypothetical protein
MSASSSNLPWLISSSSVNKICHICDGRKYKNLQEHFRKMHGTRAVCPYCGKPNGKMPKYFTHADFNTHLLAHHTENQVLKYVENLNKTLSVLQMAQADAAEIAGTKAAEREAERAAAESLKREAAAAASAAKAANKNGVLNLLQFSQAAYKNYAAKEAANHAAQSLVNLRTNQAAHTLMGMRGHSPSRSRSRSRSPRRNTKNNKKKGGYRRKYRTRRH